MSTLSPIADRFLTLTEGSAYSGLSRQSLKRMIGRQELKRCRPLDSGRPALIDLLELDRRIFGASSDDPQPAA